MNYINALIWSDLHLDAFKFHPSIPQQTDLIIIAGDTANKLKAANWLINLANSYNKPIILVPGNHEYYDSSNSPQDIQQINSRLKSIHPLIHTLINESITLFDHSFFGSTLWTSINHNDPNITKLHLQLNDFNYIHTSHHQIGYKQIGHKLSPHTYTQLHKDALHSIQLHLQTKQTTTIITHHSPIQYSYPPEYNNDPLKYYYYNDLEHLITNNPQILNWIHGHDHIPRYSLIGNTQVISNPRGSTLQQIQNFNQNYLISIPV